MPTFESDKLWRWLGDAVPDALFLVDAEGRICYANPYAHTVFGYAPGSFNGRVIEDLLPPEIRERHIAHRAHYAERPTLREMGNRTMPLYGLRADGARFPAEIRLSPLDTGSGVMTAAIVRDVTEHKQIISELAAARAAADRSNEVKSRFLGAVSHDLRQPLQALQLLHGVLVRQIADHDADASSTLAETRRALEMMSELVNAVLNVSKLESGTIPVTMAAFPVEAVFSEVRELVASAASAKGLLLKLQANDLGIRSDRALLRQLLQNLASNAVRYTDHGEVVLRATDCDADTVEITVEDTGIGIPPPALATIFEDFVQVDRPGTQYRGGVGLGLGTVRRIAELLNLPIRVESAVDIGSQFAVRVPRATAIDRPTAPTLTVGNPPRPSSRLVLFVDDHESMRNAIVMYLQSVEGYTVKAAASVAEVATIVDALDRPPAIVVSDYHLGHGLYGSDAVDLVRNRFGDGVPVIMLTGDTSAVIKRVVLTGPTRLLNKPVDVAVLTALMSEMIAANAHRDGGELAPN